MGTCGGTDMKSLFAVVTLAALTGAASPAHAREVTFCRPGFTACKAGCGIHCSVACRGNTGIYFSPFSCGGLWFRACPPACSAEFRQRRPRLK